MNFVHCLSVVKGENNSIDNNNDSTSIKQTMGGEDCKFFGYDLPF